jgi:hypothetical protein
MTRESPPKRELLFWELAARLIAEDPRVAELIDTGAGLPFAPAGRVFKEWLSVPKPDRRQWRELLREGVAFAKEAARRRGTRR